MKNKNISHYLGYILLFMLTFIALFPFYILLIMSTHESQDVVSAIHFLPGKNLFNNMVTVLKSGFILFYWNSIYIAVLASLIGVFISAMAGFALSKYKFRFRKTIYNFVLSSMMIPFGVSIVGYLIEMKNLKLTNTHIPIIICAMVSNYGVFLLTQFMKDGFPMEIMESARIDGCGEFKIFLKLALPFTRSACITLFLLIFMFSWNNFLIPLVFINKQSMYTIPLGIFALGSQYRQEYGARMFALTLATIPMLIIFAVNSKNLIRGLTAGAIKG